MKSLTPVEYDAMKYYLTFAENDNYIFKVVLSQMIMIVIL